MICPSTSWRSKIPCTAAAGAFLCEELSSFLYFLTLTSHPFFFSPALVDYYAHAFRLQETTHVSFAQYKAAQVDPVMQGGRAILDWMNGPKRAIYLKLFCKEYAQVRPILL